MVGTYIIGDFGDIRVICEMSQTRFFCITSKRVGNEPIETAFDELHTMFEVQYVVGQHEEGLQREDNAESGYVHKQVYLVLKTKMRFSVMLRKLHCLFNWSTAHVEQRKGTHDQAKAYCQKSDTRLEMWKDHGNDSMLVGATHKPNTMKRTAELVRQGVSLYDISEMDTDDFDGCAAILRHGSGMERLMRIRQKVVRRDHMEVTWIWGLSGSGKTYDAYERSPLLHRVDTPERGATMWMDGYTGQETILIDNYTIGCVRWNQLMALLDVYPLRCQVKGGYTTALWTKVIVTSIHPPRGMVPPEEQEAELMRRISVIHHCKDRVLTEVDWYSSE